MAALVHSVLGAVLGFVVAGLVLRSAESDPKLGFCLSRNMPLRWWGFHLVVAAALAWFFWLNIGVFGFQWGVLFYHVLVTGLVAAALSDLLYRLVPGVILIAVWVLVLAAEVFWGYPILIVHGIAGAVSVGGLVLALYLLTRGQGIGEADVLLAFIVGMLFGWRVGLVVFAVANMLGLVAVLPLIALLGKQRMKQIPLVFFIVIAILLEWYWGYTFRIFEFIGLTSFP